MRWCERTEREGERGRILLLSLDMFAVQSPRWKAAAGGWKGFRMWGADENALFPCERPEATLNTVAVYESLSTMMVHLR